MKINQDYIIAQYVSGVKNYRDASVDFGLWQSEQHVFEKHLKKSDRILDLGCGTGRTTFALHKLGFENIIGMDLTPAMIEAAQELNQHFKTDLRFEVGNACAMTYENESFDAVVFSFNGLMSIPSKANRAKALAEIARVLKNGGKFIFTTHDRNEAPEFFDLWKEQAKIWEAQKQDERLFEFGDLICYSKNESREIYIHIPDRAEVESALSDAGFVLNESFYRSEQFDENEVVKTHSGECRFWIAEKA